MFSITMLPAEDGDCLFVEANGYRIVIDGGRAKTGMEALPAFLSSLPAKSDRPSVDLMVLTHVDADHIAGLLALLANPKGVTIGEVWFNGYEHHKLATGAFVKPASSVSIVRKTVPSTGVLSIDQALRFDSRIRTLGISWNSKFENAAVMVEQEGDLPRIKLSEGVSLVVLGPSRRKLAALFPDWQTHFRKLAPDKVMAARARQVPTVANLTQLAGAQNVADQARPNGASITFVVEADRKRALFGADAHPDDLSAALERYGGPGRIAFDAIKVPHHGSAKNNTSVLIDRLRAHCWLVSTDGSSGHPDEEAIARVVLAPEEGKRLIFNYRSERNQAWAEPALQTRFRFMTEYGDGKGPVTVLL
jgi:beta-lactamase superfamily II metal-dependent hydrolase